MLRLSTNSQKKPVVLWSVFLNKHLFLEGNVILFDAEHSCFSYCALDRSHMHNISCLLFINVLLFKDVTLLTETEGDLM